MRSKAMVVALLTVILAAAAPMAGRAQQVSADYAVEWGSVPVARVALDSQRSEGRYRAGYAARTSGVLGYLWPYEARWVSEGLAAPDGVRPERLEAVSSLRDQERRVLVEFDRSGRVSRLEASDEQEERDPVPAELRGGPDPIALALLAVAAAGQGSRYQGQSFDGRRVMSAELRCAGEGGRVELIGLPAAESTLRCELDGRVVAGAMRVTGPRRIQGQGPIRLWLATRPGAPGWWPVRLELDTSLGTVSARLTSWTTQPSG